MERDGIVSVWAGIFETDKALMEYANEMNISFDSEGAETVSSFSRDFFDGTDAWPFDTDFWERSLHEFTDDPEVLVLPFSEGTAIGPALKRRGGTAAGVSGHKDGLPVGQAVLAPYSSPSTSRALLAAACSASFLLWPEPSPRILPLSNTSAWKVLAWSGPASPAMR